MDHNITVTRVDYALDLLLVCFHIWTRLAMTLELYKFYSIIKTYVILTNFCWPKIFSNLTCFRLLLAWRLEFNAWRCVFSIFHVDVQILVEQLYVMYIIQLLKFIIYHELLNNHQYVTSRCFRHRLGCFRLVSEPWL